MNSLRIFEILKKDELTLEEFIDLTQEEKDAFCNLPNHFFKRNFITLGNMVYIRRGHSISYLEGFKYEVHDPEVHALAEIELDRVSFIYGIPLRGSITSEAVRQFFYENDIAFWLNRFGATIKGYRIETRIPHSFDPSNKTESDLPHYLREVKEVKAFDGELIPSHATPLDVRNTIQLHWAREDYYEDKQTKHTWVDSYHGDSISNTGQASLRNSAKYNLLESHINLFLQRYLDTFRTHNIDGKLFRSAGGCSNRTSNLIARWKI